MTKTKSFSEQHASNQKYSENFSSLLSFATKEKGKKASTLVAELWRLSKGIGKISPSDYFYYQLYDDGGLSLEDKKRFISDRLHWPITSKCSDPWWRGATEDKWLSYNILGHFGIPVPRTVAIVDKSFRKYGNDPVISTADDLKAFLGAGTGFPLFAKPNREMGSFGAFIILEFSDDGATLDGDRTLSCEEIVDELIGDTPYLIQEIIENHQDIANFTSHLATVRTINLVHADRVATPFALLKIPAGDNIADNYWRTGNMLADIDLETGKIRRAVRGRGIELEILDAHPDTGDRLVGMALPDWKKLLRVNETCARLFAPVRYQSLDIALTPEGPLVVEINTGGGFDLPQIASGKGFLTDEVRAFFESCGYRFRGRQ